MSTTSTAQPTDSRRRIGMRDRWAGLLVSGVALAALVVLVALLIHLMSMIADSRAAPLAALQQAVHEVDRSFDALEQSSVDWQLKGGELDAVHGSLEQFAAAANALPADLIEVDTTPLRDLVARLQSLLPAGRGLDPGAVEQLNDALRVGNEITEQLSLATIAASSAVNATWRRDLGWTIVLTGLLFAALTAALLVTLLIVVRQRERVRRDGDRLAAVARDLQQAQRIARLGTFFWDFRADRVTWSDELATIYGLVPGGTMTGEEFRRLVHPADLAVVEEGEAAAAARSAQSGQPETRDTVFRIVRPDGTTAFVQVRSEIFADATGNMVSNTSTVRDVTADAEQRRALAESRESLATAQRIAHLGSFRIDLSTGESYWSDEMYRITDITAGPLPPPNERTSELIHPDDIGRVLAEMAAVLDNPNPGGARQLPLQHRLRWHDGTVRYVRGTAEYTFSQDGRPLLMTGTLQDVTEDVHKELALEAATRDAKKANAAKSEFLAVMSHELRTPMNGVLGMLSALAETALDDNQRRLVSVARSSADALLVLLNDILDMSKIEAGKLELEATTFELRPLVRSVVHLYVEQARSKGIKLDSEIAPDLPEWFEGDAGRLRQILLNFTSNAVKFTSSGGVLIKALRLGDTEPGKVRVRLEVVDTGIGIPADKHSEVFVSFAQLDSSYARRFGGTGLGLAISKRLAELMDGTIGFGDTPGGGTTFWIELQLAVSSPGTRTSAPESVDLPSMKVLVAEDNATNQLVAQRLLEKLGQRVDVVNNGLEALEAVRGRVYDVVLMDLSMPLMDGIEAARRIRALPPPNGRVAIIALTANALDVDIDASREAGMTGFVSKPIVHAKLVAALAEASGSRLTVEMPAAAPETPPASGLDLRRLTTLEDQVGRETMPDLLAAHVGDVARALAAMADAVETGHRSEFGRAAHSLRSVVLNLGATELSGLAADAEQLCRSDTEYDLKTNWTEISSLANALISEVTAIMQQYRRDEGDSEKPN